MGRAGRVAAAAALVVVVASLCQHSIKTAQPMVRPARAHGAACAVPAEPQHSLLRAGLDGRWRASQLVPLAASKQDSVVRIERPFIYLSNVAIGVIYVGGQLPPPDLLELDPATARNIIALTFLHHLPIPLSSSVGLMSHLFFLVSVGSFEGTIPSEIGLCTLGNLVIRDARITGPLPSELWSIPTLYAVDLTNNLLAGPLPDISAALNRFSPLLMLDNNQLSGTIPTQYGLLRHLYLSYNRLEGPIPKQVGLQGRTRYVVANHNALSGPIPSQLGLTWLWVLELAENALTGTVPSQLGQLESAWLSLSRNHLEGSIPSEIGLLTDLQWLDLSDNALSGTLPTQLLLLTSLLAFRIGNNALSGPLVAPPNANVTCDFSGVDHPGCLADTFEFVGGGAFAAVVAGASATMALELLVAAWLVARRNLERVERFGLAVALLTVGGVFVVCSSAVWFALASVDGAHSARSSYCRAALHSAVLGMHLIVAPCAAHVGLAWLGKQHLPLQMRRGWRASPMRVVLLVGLSIVPVVAITTGASVGVEASAGPGCDYTGPSVVLVLVCPAVLAVVACATSAISLAIRDGNPLSAHVAHMRRALGTNAVFTVALVSLAPFLRGTLPRFLSLSLAALVSAVTFTAIVHVPLVRGK